MMPRHAYDSEGLYVFGGYHRTVLRTGEMYDANTDVWRWVEFELGFCQKFDLNRYHNSTPGPVYVHNSH